ncbi:MAG TPA: hypothetical protein VFN97_08790 [Actinospica sp.]|nr:hypothetical protein [Actinospica sp.]
MQHRRILVPLALAGSFGIALAPGFAMASTTSHSAVSPAFGTSTAKSGNLKQFSSPLSKSVFSRHAASADAASKTTSGTTSNPDLAVYIGGGQISTYGVELVAGFVGLDNGSATLTISWGDGTTQTITDVTAQSDGGGVLDYTHTYSALGAYDVTVTLTDAYSDTATNTTVVQTASEYTAFGPFRILDTRAGTGAAKAAIAAHGTLKFKVVGTGGNGVSVPTGATAVVLNVTATQVNASGVLTVYNNEDADGYSIDRPETSNLNFGKGQTVANLVVVPVGADGTVDFYNGSTGTTQVVADVQGYYTAASAATYTPITPTRVLDTRKGTGTGGTIAKIAAGGSVTLTIGGVGSVPSTATAAQLNITAVNGTHSGFITADGGAGASTASSNVNYGPNQAVANSAIVPFGDLSTDSHEITLHNSSTGPVDLVVDVSGYYQAAAVGGSAYIPLYAPERIYDSRVKDNGVYDGPLSAGKTVPFPITNDTLETAFVLNATVTGTTGNGYLELYPYNGGSTALPGTSTLNWVKGQTIPNLAVVSAGTVLDGNFGSYDLGLYVGGTGTAQVVLDAFGFFPSN